MFLYCILFIFGLYIYSKIEDPQPIFGIYTLPGKWYSLKYYVFLFVIYFRKDEIEIVFSELESPLSIIEESFLQDLVQLPNGLYHHNYPSSRLSNKYGKAGSAGQGVKSHSKIEDMDCAQPLSNHAKAFDAVFFISANKDGYYVVAGCERRQMGIVNGLFYIILPDKRVLCSPKIPDTLLFGAKVNEFGAEGLLFTPKDPMKRWHLSYKGKMCYKDNPDKCVHVSFDGEWSATTEYFDYDTDLDMRAVARSIAREPWTSKYFNDLKRAHQSHYDQFGSMEAEFFIDDENHKVTLDSFRDHSYGHKRDWELMHRYAFHHIFLSNGWKISVGVICQPCTGTTLEVGFIWTQGSGNVAIESCDLQLYQHGENGTAPTDYAFTFKANGNMYTVQVNVVEQSIHYVSSHWDARMVERFAKFTVNGVDGWGVTEFHYNHKGGRPEERLLNDPEWFQALRNNV